MKASPFEVVEVRAPHTGIVEFVVSEPGAQVHGTTGVWNEKPGTLLAKLGREHNAKAILAPLKGEVEKVFLEHSGRFVEAGTTLFTLRHYLTKDEVISAILKKTLHLFHAPEQAKYYFTPEIDTKVKASGCKCVRVREGMDLFIVSRMKRETPLAYAGPEGLIYAVYFQHNESVAAGEPLIGVCPEELLPVIQEVVNRVQGEWEER
nr:biotin attachment protein [Desulfobaculum xiamenense]